MDPEQTQDPEQQAGQEGQPQPQEEAQQAPEEIAERYGYDPELFRSQYEEVKRREREVEQREKEWQRKSREPRYTEPPLDQMDPNVAYLARMIQEDREERRQEREERDREREAERDTQRLSVELERSYSANARFAGWTPDRIDKESSRVFDTLVRLYPEREMIRAIGADVAMKHAIEFARQNGHAPQTTTTRVSPRTTIVTAQGTGPIEDREDTGPQRQGESGTEYAQRVLRNYEKLGLKGMGLKDGERISSE